MENTSIAFLIGLMAGSIFFIDGWGPTGEKDSDDFIKSKRFRGLSVLVAGGIITPILDYVTTKKPEFFLAYLKGCIYGWFFVLLVGLLLYLIWISTKKLEKPKLLCQIGKFSYAIMDFIYLGISDNPHIQAKRKSEVALAEKLYGLQNEFEYKQVEKELEKRESAPDVIDYETKKLVEKKNEETTTKAENDYNFNDWYYKGVTEFQKDEFEKCIAYMKNAIEKDSKNVNAPDAYLYMGLSYERIGLPQKGISQYDIIIRDYTSYKSLYLAYYDKAVILRDQELYEQALEVNEVAITLNPLYTNAWVNKGFILAKLKRFSEALLAYDEAMKLRPDDADTWNHIANALFGESKDEEALKAYDEALKLRPTFVDAMYNKAWLLNKLNRADEAVKTYEQLIRVQPNDAEAWYNLSGIFAAKNDKDKTISHLKKAIELDKRYKTAALENTVFGAFLEDADFKLATAA